VPGSLIFNLNYAEKGLLWLKLKATGSSGHGHSPHVRYAALDMLEFLDAVRHMESGPVIGDETALFFYQLGEASSFPNSFLLKRSRNAVVKQVLSLFINKNRFLRSMTSNTRTVTGFHADESGINVIANQATANLDIRLLPGVAPKAYLERIVRLAKQYNVEVQVAGMNEATASPIKSDFFKVLGRVAMQNVPGAVVAPFLSPGGTDCAYFRKIDMDCYGLIPILADSDELDGLHGKNESITEDNLRLGTRIIFETLIGMNR
ncbi:MAG: M20/M25/M40 family metallo-hydrolase, partial [Spirochaetia bacterium]|nr:M20/M25/M40 family metallo-hydrolase [Spirochaetia bacterium]